MADSGGGPQTGLAPPPQREVMDPPLPAEIPTSITSFLAQLSRCAHTITFRKPYIASLEIGMIGQMDCWTVVNFGLLDHLTITMLHIR